jgi:hypothetical protein
LHENIKSKALLYNIEPSVGDITFLPTMHSIGVYAKDDNNKGEHIDGGGGVTYEQDVTDDEGEGAEDATEEKAVEELADEENAPNEEDKE